MNGLAATTISELHPQHSELFDVRTLIRELDHLLAKGRERSLTLWELNRLSELPNELIRTASSVGEGSLAKCCEEIVSFSELCVRRHDEPTRFKPLQLN